MSTASLSTDESQRLQTSLTRAGTPQTLKNLAKQTRIPVDGLRPLISDAIARGAAYRWPDARGQQRFWYRDADQFAREQILAVASEVALKPPDLSKAARKRLPGFPAKLVAGLIDELVRGKKLLKFAPLVREKYLLGANPQAYAAAAQLRIDAIQEQVRAAGVAEADPRSAILEGMLQLEPLQMGPVSVRELRAILKDVSKREFDEAALKLRAEQRVYLSRHDFPQSLPPAELDNLINGRDGNYYVAISARHD